MTDPISFAVSILALFISGLTAWLTLRRGKVKMTRPTVVYFGPDEPTHGRATPYPKIYFRTLLFSTTKRGRVIENIFVTLEKDGVEKNFSIWVHDSGKMLRGSGLFVGETGIEATHQFITHDKDSDHTFDEGSYQMRVFGQMLSSKSEKLLFSETFVIASETAEEMRDNKLGVYFDWEPHSQTYITHIDKGDLAS